MDEAGGYLAAKKAPDAGGQPKAADDLAACAARFREARFGKGQILFTAESV